MAFLTVDPKTGLTATQQDRVLNFVLSYMDGDLSEDKVASVLNTNELREFKRMVEEECS